MTKDEIKKALECCSNKNAGSCNDCPYNDAEFSCAHDEMCKDTLNLITEQENEIGTLKTQVKQAKIDVLNKAKERAVGLTAIETYHICNLIDELIKEVQDE